MKPSPQLTLFDPYAVLELERRCDRAAIKRAYFRLVRAYPPESAPEKFQEIRRAYEMLRNPERRAQADLFLLQAPSEPPLRDDREDPRLLLAFGDVVQIAFALADTPLSLQKEFHEPQLP